MKKEYDFSKMKGRKNPYAKKLKKQITIRLDEPVVEYFKALAEENDISYQVRGAIFKKYNAFGPGLLESVYVAGLLAELNKLGLKVRKEVAVPVYYEGEKLEVGFRLDLLVENKVIIEVKSVENLAPVHHKQLLTYLKLTKLKLGVLVNFNVDDITTGIFRKVNNL